jgi:hypothetical protein
MDPMNLFYILHMLKFTKKSIMDLTWLAIVGVGVRVG